MQISMKAARVNAGMTQEKVAAALGVSTACLCRWERGSRLPGLVKFFQLCELYGVAPSDILLPEKSGQA